MSRSTPSHLASRTLPGLVSAKASAGRSADTARRRSATRAFALRTHASALRTTTLALLGGMALSAAPPSAGPEGPALRPGVSATKTSAPAADAAFSSFFGARTAREAAAASDQIVASGVGFDEAYGRLRQGRAYSRGVPRGVVQGSYGTETGEYFYTLDVPESYDPARKYQVRVQLHGGLGRIEANAP